MARILLFVFLLALVGAFLQSTSQIDGEVLIHFYEYEIKTSTQFVLIVAFILAVFVFFIGQLWAFLVQAPQNFEKWRYTKKYQQGFDYFVESLNALKAGDLKQAQKLGKKTQKLLPDARLKSYLGAELAITDSKPLKAIPHYEELIKRKDSSFMGLLGLLDQYIKLSDWTNVKKYALQAYAMKNKNKLVINALLKANYQLNDFDGLLNLISNAQKHSSYTSEFLDEVEAFCFLSQAMEEVDVKQQQKLLKKSLKASAINLPAIEMLYDLQGGNTSEKLKFLSSSFRKVPHPRLYEEWLQVVENEPQKYYKRRLKALLKGHEKSFIGFYVQALEFYRRGEFKDALIFAQKAFDLNQMKCAFHLKVLCLNELEMQAEIKQTLEKYNNLHNDIFIGDESCAQYKKWQNKTFFDEGQSLTDTAPQTRLLTNV